MCLFQFKNTASFKALNKGITHFDCGGCPECMQKKSRYWALRCAMESKVSCGVMVTLTYDTYKYESEAQAALDRQKLDEKSKQWLLSKYEENPTDPTIPLSKRDCQLFIKRLRKHFSGKKIKYLLTAERGKRSHRAHYHALLFGVKFDDLIKYKKSDRGNWIYKSRTLDKIWKHGICTVDCINLSAQTARYCTKYCAKDSGQDDTFMLFSRGIGMNMLKKKFNGKSYWIDGREYSIPKQVWQWYIERKYGIDGYSRYVPKRKLYDIEKVLDHQLTFSNKPCKDIMSHYVGILAGRDWSHARGKARNDFYAFCRDNDKMYQRYIDYWKRKASVYEALRPTPEMRILALPDNKYRSYKVKALQAKSMQLNGIDTDIPRSNSQGLKSIKIKKVYAEKSFAPLSRHYRANDTIKAECSQQIALLRALRLSILIQLDPQQSKYYEKMPV